MKAGDIANIYQMPMTQEVFEGRAKLLRKHDVKGTEAPLELWEVEFLSDGYRVMRWIWNFTIGEDTVEGRKTFEKIDVGLSNLKKSLEEAGYGK